MILTEFYGFLEGGQEGRMGEGASNNINPKHESMIYFQPDNERKCLVNGFLSAASPNDLPKFAVWSGSMGRSGSH